MEDHFVIAHSKREADRLELEGHHLLWHDRKSKRWCLKKPGSETSRLITADDERLADHFSSLGCRLLWKITEGKKRKKKWFFEPSPEYDQRREEYARKPIVFVDEKGEIAGGAVVRPKVTETSPSPWPEVTETSPWWSKTERSLRRFAEIIRVCRYCGYDRAELIAVEMKRPSRLRVNEIGAALATYCDTIGRRLIVCERCQGPVTDDLWETPVGREAEKILLEVGAEARRIEREGL